MRIKVKQGVQVVHDGTVYADGASADVSETIGQFWVRSGWATEVTTTPKPKKARR
jgi:hypothetical protein